MIGVAFHYRGTSDPEFSFDSWRIDMEALGATHLFVIDESRYKNSHYYQTSAMVKETYLSLEDMRVSYPDVARVFLETPTACEGITLHDFDHPESVIYIVGSNISSIPKQEGTWVTFPVKEKKMTYARTAAAIALYDRQRQWPLP